jgi:hypothetical protein
MTGGSMADEMTAATDEQPERFRRWKECQDHRAEGRRKRQRMAEACCVDCGIAGRDDLIEQATYHTKRAKEAENEANLLKAAALEKTAAHLFLGALIIGVFSLLVLAFSLIALLDG